MYCPWSNLGVNGPEHPAGQPRMSEGYLSRIPHAVISLISSMSAVPEIPMVGVERRNPMNLLWLLSDMSN